MAEWAFEVGLEGGTWQWPADRDVYLLIDGARVKQLARRLYEWSFESGLEADLLYAGTPLSEVSEISPWLIALPGACHPVLQAFLVQGLHDEWGYLLESQASLEDLGGYLRKLLQVRHPSGIAMWLRLADPAVIDALLPDQSSPAVAPWGPIEALVRPDGVTTSWIRSTPGVADTEALSSVPKDGIQLNDRQLCRLQACDKRRDIRNLMSFVDAHCSHWSLPQNLAERYGYLEILTDTARRYGFSTPRQWGLLCTLFTRVQSMTWSSFEKNASTIYACLTVTSDAPPDERLKRALALSSTYSETT